MTNHDYTAEALLDKLTAERILDSLDPEERDIIEMCLAGSFTLEEIGRTIGQAYHGKDLKASVIRYHRDKILANLRIRYRK